MPAKVSGHYVREQFLGGSDVAGVLGLNPWATPLDIYYRKVGYPKELPRPDPDPQRERMLRRGKLMEPVVVDMLKAEHPIKITKRSTPRKPNHHRDAEFPFLACEIDFEWTVTPAMRAEIEALGILVDGTTQNGEVKTVHPFGAGIYGEEGTDEIPVQYACQGMHGLGVTGRQACLVPVLVGSDNLLLYHVLRDDALIKAMRARCVHFWTEHVVKRIPPPPQDLGDVHKLLRVRPETVVQADADLIALVENFHAANERKRVADEASKHYQFEVCKRLVGPEAAEAKVMEGRHRIMHGNVPLLNVQLQGRESVNAAELKADHPDVFKEYSKLSTFFVCRKPAKRKS